MKKNTCVIGNRFEKLVVLEEFREEYVREKESRKTVLKLKCLCDCGTIFYPYKSNVIQGKTKGCIRCAHHSIVIGEKIGELTVLSRILLEKSSEYLCRCNCGQENIYKSTHLIKRNRYCCDRCRYPKKYAPKPPKKTRKEVMVIVNYMKHTEAVERVIGSKRGKLKFLSFSHWEINKSRRRPYYLAKCKCGKTFTVRIDAGNKSCGCSRKDSMPKGQDHCRSVLTNSQAKAIREFKESNIGYTNVQIAKIFGVTVHIISSVVLGKTYKD